MKKIMIVLSTLIFISSCSSSSDADKIVDAQECLDEYARNGGGDVDACVSKVSGLTSAASHGIRCAAGFIKEGKGGATFFVNAFQTIETVSGSAIANFLNVVGFKSAGTGNLTNATNNYNTAATVYDYCALSKAKGATLIATFSFLTNMLFKLSCENTGSTPAGDCNMDDTSAGTAIVGSATTWVTGVVAFKTALGTMVINTHEVSCSTGNANDTLCGFMSNAIAQGGGVPATVGQKFLEILANP